MGLLKVWAAGLMVAALGIGGCGVEEQATTPITPVHEPVVAVPPVQNGSVVEMIEDRGDYAVETRTFKLISEDPLHIQLSPSVSPADEPKYVQEDARRTLIYGIYRTFIHTDVDKVRVTSIPLEIVDLQSYKTRYLEDQKIELEIDRDGALNAVKAFLPVNAFADLVVSEAGRSVQLDKWTDNFRAYLFNQDGAQMKLIRSLQENSAK